jgi:hypothetical protein
MDNKRCVQRRGGTTRTAQVQVYAEVGGSPPDQASERDLPFNHRRCCRRLCLLSAVLLLLLLLLLVMSTSRPLGRVSGGERSRRGTWRYSTTYLLVAGELHHGNGSP